MPNKPNQASKEWNHQGLTEGNKGHVRVNPHSSIRRCGRCEAEAVQRQQANEWVWVSEVGDWYPIPKTGVQLLPRTCPPHHENEHYDSGVRTFNSGSTREAYTGVPEQGHRVRPYAASE
jgi:hypothetical protein